MTRGNAVSLGNEARLLRLRRAWGTLRLPLTALLVAAAYSLGAWLGFALRLPGASLPAFWPPNALVLAALLLTARSHWWLWLLAVAPVQLAVSIGVGLPLIHGSLIFTHNALMLLLAASLLRRCGPEAWQLLTLRGVLLFLLTVLGLALLLPLGSIPSGLAFGLLDSFWGGWQQLALANAMAYLTLLPAILLTAPHGRAWLRSATRLRIVEAVLLATLLLSVGEFVFGVLLAGPASGTYIRAAILPLLLWAAVRFGPGGLSLAVTALTLLVLWNSALGNGPFVRAAPIQNVLNLQSYVLGYAAPLLLLAVLIAERRRTEAALVQLNTQLEQRVAARTAELAQTNTQLAVARDQAESASRAKSDFLATMSHELRTPLHTILGYNRRMLGSPALPPAPREQALVVQRSAEHLLTLINSMLDLSKIKAGKIPLHPTSTDLHWLLDGLLAMFHLQAERKGLFLRGEIAADTPRQVVVDAVKLRQVLINLVANAIKFTGQGGVSISLRRAEDEPAPVLNAGSSPLVTLLFTVADTGPGIAPSERQAMFEAFVQTRAGQQTGEGTGLGLAISQQFVRVMGGEICVQSTEGHGSVFSVRLPTQALPDDPRRPALRTLAPLGSSGDIDQAALASLPADLLAVLEHVSIEGNPEHIATVIAQVQRHAPKLATTLQALADQVAFDVIQAAARQAQAARGRHASA
jgi:signal transduction histidine kinase